jgi:hypothetical protein
MDTVIVVMISLLVTGFGLGFYMDWFGLWVSDKEMNAQIASSASRCAPVKRV